MKSKGKEAGRQMADSLINWAHLFYNAHTAKRVIKAAIERLQERIEEFKPVKKG